MFYPHVKSEAEASPDLSPVHHNFHFKFPPSHDHQSRTPSDPPTPLYRFGQYPTNPANPSPPSSHTISYMSYSDDYDDLPIHNYPQSASDRTIRRRSSKACDQCRKSKCKCERSSPNEPCKSCIMLGTPCTFLGPSRKRGPPKGYIDAIEARLHQTEALVGIMLATKDPRAQSLLRDIARDPLAKEIIIRVDASPYGVKGRKRTTNTTTPPTTTVEHHASSPTTNKKTSTAEPDTPKDEGKIDLTSTHPSNEWQDRVVDMLGAGKTTEPTYIRPTPSTSTTSNGGSGKPTLRVATYTSDDHSPSGDGGRERRRRRLGDEDYDYEGITVAAAAGLPSPTSTSASLPSSKEEEGGDGLEEENQLAQAVGELSLNEDEEVRYHGQASGLYLLGETERIDKRNEGGIWRFPGARVWPPLPPPTPLTTTTTTMTESRENEGSESEAGHVTSKVMWPQQQQQQQSTSDAAHRAATSSPALHKFSNGLNGEELLPPRHEQERLLELYFIYVHPSFPVVHKKAFWEVWRHGEDVDPYTKRTYRITPLLLLTMFALAARYDIPPPTTTTTTTTTADSPSSSSSPPSPSSFSSEPTTKTTTTAATTQQPIAEASSPTTPLPTDGISMWTAGEQYFNSAKNILDTSYASSRPSTCQALLLMGYREVGIGAMALAWTYVGMAIRMAQDLGMHRKAEGWRRPGLLGSSGSSGSSSAAAAAAAAATNEDSEMEGTAAPPATATTTTTTSSEEAGRIFGDWELGERRRIWFGCVVMDKYVSAYIGRPLMISERDFDTQVPELSESEEMEEWKALGVDGQWTTPVPGRVVSCFNKCAELSGVLSAIIQAIYAVRPFPTGPNPSPTFRPGGGGSGVGSRQVETAKQVTALEGTLDRWYLDLPHHLRYDTAAVTIMDRGVDATNNTTTTTSSSLPPAHVLTLHMQYWCAVLLLHRPFIHKALNSNKTKMGAFSSGMISEEQHQTLPDLDDLEVIKSRRSYELCVSAANHITSIVTTYRERYPLNRCSVFLCYYVFTASIMHVITLKAYPDDPQAPINLRRCLDALTAMRYVWPSAGRALELLTGAKMNLMMTTGGGPPPSARAYAVNGNHKASSSTVSSNKRKSSTIALDEEKVHPSASSASSMVNGVSMEGGGRGGGGGRGAEFVTPIRSAAGLSAHMDQQQQHQHQHQQQHSVQLQHRLRESASQQQLGQYRPVRQQHQQHQHHTYHTATPTDSYSIQPPTLLVPADYGWPVSVSSGVRNVTAGEESSGARGAAAHLPEEDQEFVPLSTSVLPQLYSTGLVDEHPHTVHHRHHHHHLPQPPPHLLAATTAAAAPTTTTSPSSSSHHGGQTHPQHIQQGYNRSGEIIPHPYGHTTQPQYWSDYSTFSQLESTEAGGGYGSLDVGVGGVGAMEMVLPGSQHPQQQQQQQQQQPHLLSHSQHPNVSSVSGMYLPDSYDLYGDGYR